MKVDTYLFGSVEVNPEKVITFPNGLVGFESSTRFTLVHENDVGESASFTLQSLDDPTLAFQIVDPTTLGYNYELALSDAAGGFAVVLENVIERGLESLS